MKVLIVDDGLGMAHHLIEAEMQMIKEPFMPLSVAIIGTREPDMFQRDAACKLAQQLSKRFKIKTGAALGTDHVAMTNSAPKMLEVYLPWASYNREIIPVGCTTVVYNPAIHKEWTSSVLQYHPCPGALSRGAIALHARNYGIVEKCVAVIALPSETGSGGTGQGIRIANALNIPVFQGNRGQVTDPFIPNTLAAIDKIVAELWEKAR